MSVHHHRPWWGVAVAAAIVVAACTNSMGPQAHLSDPAALSTNLQTVSGVLQSTTFHSFSALGRTTGSPAAAPTRAGALLGAAPLAPPRSATQPYANAPARLQTLRTAASTLGGGINASVIPPSDLGKTYIWDAVTTHGYVVGPDPGPTNGVRIILYAIDPVTEQVVEPPVAVGFVDLLDESTTSPAVNKLHVILKGGTPASPGTTYADYTVSASVTGSPATSFTATANGFVSDGTRTLTFSATFVATNLTTNNPDAQIDVIWDLDNPVVHVELHETLATSDADHLVITLHFTFTHGTETVSVDGTIAVVVSSQTVTANLNINVNGVPYATITGTNQGIQLLHADHSQLSTAELQAVSDLFALPDAIEIAIDGLFHPCQHLMGA